MKWKFNRKNPDKIIHIKSTRRWLLLIPFAIITLLLVVVPMVLIIVKSFLNTQDGSTTNSWVNNWSMLGSNFIWNKMLISIFDAVITTIVCVILSYPFAYFLSMSKNKIYKSLTIFIATAPIWTSFLVKLLGLKTFFDLMNGVNNSTFGNVYTIIGLIYLYMPFMIMPLYSVLNDMPKNLVNASYDLGYGGFMTFIKIVVPYTKVALFSGITLVFLPSLTTVAVPQFLNNSNDSSLISDIIVDQGNQAVTSQIALARASTLSLVLSLVILGGYGLFMITYKFTKNRKLKQGGKRE